MSNSKHAKGQAESSGSSDLYSYPWKVNFCHLTCEIDPVQLKAENYYLVFFYRTARLAAYTVLSMKVAFSLMFSSGVGLMALVVSCGLWDPFSTSLQGRSFDVCHSHHPVIVQMDCGSL